jgi:sn-glycerol 3-phosphate transport system permease protein
VFPDELAEAARVDGAGPMRFFFDILLPMSRTVDRGAVRDPVHLRLEPVSLAVADHDQGELLHGRHDGLAPGPASTRCPQWNLLMAMAMLAMLPPVLVVMFMQRQFVRGLVETEK